MIDPEIIKILIGIGRGLIYGAIAAAVGFLKTDENGHLEDFDKQKFTKTVIIGAIVGGIAGAGVTDSTWNDAATQIGISVEVLRSIVMVGITWLADQIVKLIWRRFKIETLVNKLKGLFKNES
jgi:hypothetical protein